MLSITKHKRAHLDYEINDTYDAGIVLFGHEVKSVKSKQANLVDATAWFVGKILRLYNLDIPLYKKTSRALVPDYNPKRKRQLLLNQKEMARISAALDRKGMVLFPLEVYLSKSGKVKIKLGVWHLRKKIEKKQILKEKDIDRQMKKEMKHYS